MAALPLMTSWFIEARATHVQLRESALSSPTSVVSGPIHPSKRPGDAWQRRPNQPIPQAPQQITRSGLIKVFAMQSNEQRWACGFRISLRFDLIFLFNLMIESKMLFFFKHLALHIIHISKISCAGFYLSAELWKHPAGTQVAIMTPVMESTVSDGDCLMFWYHMEGSGVGELSVYLQGVGEARRPVSWTRGYNEGKHWRHGRVTLISGVPFHVRGCWSVIVLC